MGTKVWRRLMRRRATRRPAARAVLGLEPLEARAVPTATHYLLNGASFATAGTALVVSVNAVDPPGVTDPSYLGKVHFASSDPLAALPPDYTFTPSDAGSHAFSITLKTAGGQTITATDANLPGFNGSLTGLLVGP